MIREEFDEEVQLIRSNVGGYGNTKSSLEDIVYYVDQIEVRYGALLDKLKCSEHNYNVQVENGHTAYKNYTNMFDSLKQQNQTLIDIVEMQSNRIKELEEPKTCDGCIHKPLHGNSYYEPCGTCKQFYSYYHEAKEV